MLWIRCRWFIKVKKKSISSFLLIDESYWWISRDKKKLNGRIIDLDFRVKREYIWTGNLTVLIICTVEITFIVFKPGWGFDFHFVRIFYKRYWKILKSITDISKDKALVNTPVALFKIEKYWLSTFIAFMNMRKGFVLFELNKNKLYLFFCDSKQSRGNLYVALKIMQDRVASMS